MTSWGEGEVKDLVEAGMVRYQPLSVGRERGCEDVWDG